MHAGYKIALWVLCKIINRKTLNITWQNNEFCSPKNFLRLIQSPFLFKEN